MGKTQDHAISKISISITRCFDKVSNHRMSSPNIVYVFYEAEAATCRTLCCLVASAISRLLYTASGV